jgi:tetratricopeptide (TPR) repeat protein
MTTPGKLKPAALTLNSAVRPGMLIPKHAAWVCVSRFGVPQNALAVLLILHCALWVTPGLAAKTKDASKADSLSWQVVDLYQAGKYQEAIPIARQALAIREKTLGPEHPETAQGLNNLARLYEAIGDQAKAEPLYRRTLAIREKALGPEHPDTAISLNNLAGLYEAMGDHARAEPLHRRALAIREKVLGPEQ